MVDLIKYLGQKKLQCSFGNALFNQLALKPITINLQFTQPMRLLEWKFGSVKTKSKIPSLVVNIGAL